MVKLCLYGNTGTMFQLKTFFGTHSQGAINHFLLQMNVIVGGPFTQKKYLDSKVPSWHWRRLSWPRYRSLAVLEFRNFALQHSVKAWCFKKAINSLNNQPGMEYKYHIGVILFTNEKKQWFKNTGLQVFLLPVV